MILEASVTTTVAAECITQRVYLEYPFAREHVMSRMIDTMDEQVIKGLVALGWTPPNHKELTS